jgi:peptidoglycan/LPS O-acetylase OafA/YrhL
LKNAKSQLSFLFSGSISELRHPAASQIPYLDGMRTIAVLLVVAGHFSGKFLLAGGDNIFTRSRIVSNAWIGVDLFFVLSGFFIGGQLWRELQDRGTIDVKRFILRRGFRIWPLYFFIFACVFVYRIYLGHWFGHADPKELGWSDLIFITNYHNRGIVMGSWSLCTEEQFYIIAPLALFFAARVSTSLGNYRRWMWGVLLSFSLIRAIAWISLTGNFFSHTESAFAPLYYGSITHCDGLVMGMIISNLWVMGEKSKSWYTAPGFLVCGAVALLVGAHQFQKEIFDFLVLALMFGSVVWLGLQVKITLFNSKIFYWISKLSFGMYLNHEYFCPWVARELLGIVPYAWRFSLATCFFSILFMWTFSAALALGTFCLVEYPFLQMRKLVLGHSATHGSHQPKRDLVLTPVKSDAD